MRERRTEQDRTYDGWSKREDPLGGGGTLALETDAPPAARSRRERPSERQRRRLFGLCNPETILAPANVVAVYLGEHPMWKSWGWDETQAVNAAMLPVVQALDRDHPLPDDPRLALPFTVAGFMLYRALHVDPTGHSRNSAEVVMTVYEEIVQGIVTMDRCFTDACARKLSGQVASGFLDAFAETAMTAETLLLHAVRLGPETWNLILECRLRAQCLLKRPYYVTRPGKKTHHGACRTAKSRASQRVTLKPHKREK